MRQSLFRNCVVLSAFIVIFALSAVLLVGCNKKSRSAKGADVTAGPRVSIGKLDRSERPTKSSNRDSTWEQNVRIRSALDQGDPARAERLARAIVEKQPANAEAHFLLGKALAAQNKAEAARSYFEKSVVLAPDNNLYRLTLAENLDKAAQESLSRRDFSKAIEFWKRCLSMKYEPAATAEHLSEAYRLFGDSLRKKHRDTDAEKCYREAISQLPEDTTLRLDLAKLLIDSDRLLEAERVLKELLEKNPNSIEGSLVYARLLERMGDIKGAENQVNRLLQTNPDLKEAKDLKAELAKAVPISSSEVNLMNTTSSEPGGADEVDSQFDPAIVQKLTALESSGDYQGQAALLRKYLASHPEADWAKLRLVMALERADDIPAALAAVEEYLNKHPQDTRAKFFKARCLQLSGKLDDALQILYELERDGKANLQVYDEIGQIYAKKGKFEEAKTAWNKALAIDPDYAGVAFNFGQLAMEQRDFATARAWFDKAIQQEPYNAKYRYFAGLNLKQAGLENEAKSVWQSAKAWLNTGDPYGARILRALGEDVTSTGNRQINKLTDKLAPSALERDESRSAFSVNGASSNTSSSNGASSMQPFGGKFAAGNSDASSDSNVLHSSSTMISQTINPISMPTSAVTTAKSAATTAIDQEYLDALNAAREGNFANAMAGFKNVLRQNPNNINALINLGKIYTAQNQHSLAAIQYLLATRVAPDNPYAAKALIKSYIELGLHRQAAELTGRLLQSHPELTSEFPDYKSDAPLPRSNPRAYEPFVRLLLENRLPQEALPIIKTAVEENPDMARLVVLEGEVQYCLGQLEAAEATLQRAISMDNANPVPFIKLGDLYAATQRLELAFAQYQLAQKARFLDPDTAFEIYDRLVAIGKKSEANMLLNRLKGMNLSDSQLEKLNSRISTNKN